MALQSQSQMYYYQKETFWKKNNNDSLINSDHDCNQYFTPGPFPAATELCELE